MRIHGGADCKNKKMLDFSANINPLGMPEAVRDAVIRCVDDCARYPDPHCTVLTEKIAEWEKISCSRIVCGNGAADLIDRIARAFRPRRALICAPTFSEYAYALHETGCVVSEYALRESNQFRLDEAFLSAITPQTDMVILCTPNNPTGQRIAPELLCRITEKCSRYGIMMVSDECFLRFAGDAEQYSLYPHLHENCIILNAFTKLYAMAGLRLGYALCGSEKNAGTLRQTGQYWSVSVPAQAAGIAALSVTDWIPETVRYVSAERAILSDALRKSGLTVFDGDTNFLLIRANEVFADIMERHGIFIRRCDDFHGLSNVFFRIAVRTHEENLALISALKEEYPWQKRS